MATGITFEEPRYPLPLDGLDEHVLETGVLGHGADGEPCPGQVQRIREPLRSDACQGSAYKSRELRSRPGTLLLHSQHVLLKQTHNQLQERSMRQPSIDLEPTYLPLLVGCELDGGVRDDARHGGRVPAP